MTSAANLTLSSLTLDRNPFVWITSPNLKQSSLKCEPEVFLSVTAHLIANPNVQTSLLFRADILHDSAGVLKTPQDKESELLHRKTSSVDDLSLNIAAFPAEEFPGFELRRTVIRKFIPRNPKLDKPLEQTCHFYDNAASRHGGEEKYLVVYTPHVLEMDELPWYHPAARSLAFLYQFTRNASEQDNNSGSLSLHFLPFSPGIPQKIPTRLERTLQALLTVQLRLMRGTVQNPTNASSPNPYKDNIVPQHTVQNTYMQLKDRYAPSLLANWSEDTEPSKHVFEDLGIAAFLIELWRLMYNNRPFAGFVDIACGNGVLVHILLSEGYPGWGLDARRRKTWSIFPQTTQNQLKEMICIPQPFEDVLSTSVSKPIDYPVSTHAGIFDQDTFIISNHADELTLWTPLLGLLSNLARPLPFLAIPCCSHALSGARYRYSRPKKALKTALYSRYGRTEYRKQEAEANGEPEQNPQPASGDLRALRAEKQRGRRSPGATPSMYGCLVAKVVSVAKEVGYEVEKTMLRIPSTRSMAVIGGLRDVDGESKRDVNKMLELVSEVVKRETEKDGGVEKAAKTWIKRALGLQRSKGGGSSGKRSITKEK